MQYHLLLSAGAWCSNQGSGDWMVYAGLMSIVIAGASQGLECEWDMEDVTHCESK